MAKDWFRICLPGEPRTKKNSSNVFPMISMDGIQSLIKRLQWALTMDKGGHREAVKALMSEINFSIHPSDPFQEWFDLVYLYRSSIQSQITAMGFKLPLTGAVSIEATFYRSRLIGDWSGFTQALGDAIQAEQWKCGSCKKKTYVLAGCPHCPGKISGMTHARKGLGLIADDGQIVHWDGTRLDKDAAKPRIEFTIHIIKAAAPQASLFETDSQPDQSDLQI